MPTSLRIYVPNTSPYDNAHWYQTVLGRIVKPALYPVFDGDWYWFCPYMMPREGGIDDQIPAEFEVDGHLRHVKIRIKPHAPARQVLEQRVYGEGCKDVWEIQEADSGSLANFDIDGWWINDLGGDRFLGEPRTNQRPGTERNSWFSTCTIFRSWCSTCLPKMVSTSGSKRTTIRARTHSERASIPCTTCTVRLRRRLCR